jgi:hypothetical protein
MNGFRNTNKGAGVKTLARTKKALIKNGETDTHVDSLPCKPEKVNKKICMMRLFPENHKMLAWAADGYGTDMQTLTNKIIENYFGNKKTLDDVREQFNRRAQK